MVPGTERRLTGFFCWEIFGGKGIPVSTAAAEAEPVYMNPGSASIPKEDSRHGDMMLDENGVVWKEWGRKYPD